MVVLAPRCESAPPNVRLRKTQCGFHREVHPAPHARECTPRQGKSRRGAPSAACAVRQPQLPAPTRIPSRAQRQPQRTRLNISPRPSCPSSPHAGDVRSPRAHMLSASSARALSKRAPARPWPRLGYSSRPLPSGPVRASSARLTSDARTRPLRAHTHEPARSRMRQRVDSVECARKWGTLSVASQGQAAGLHRAHFLQRRLTREWRQRRAIARLRPRCLRASAPKLSGLGRVLTAERGSWAHGASQRWALASPRYSQVNTLMASGDCAPWRHDGAELARHEGRLLGRPVRMPAPQRA